MTDADFRFSIEATREFLDKYKALEAENQRLLELIAECGRLAVGGLCQFTGGGKHAFLSDIDKLCKPFDEAERDRIKEGK